MHRASRTFRPYRLLRSAVVGTIAALVIFEVMHRVLRLDEALSGAVLALALIPALVTGLVRQVAALLADPDGRLHTLGLAFANILVAIFFFAFIYLELGISSPADPEQREVSSFLTCLYFSASIITTTGLGDFAPNPETRLIAAVEMIFGYLAFGIVIAATFALLDHRSRRTAGREEGGPVAKGP